MIIRKLASIQRIKAIRPIPKADAIEVADVLGWHIVIKKGEFAVNDKVVFCEIDSVLPDKPEFEFLNPSRRIRTMCFRGQVSQGICFPLSVLPCGEYAEGEDVSNLLGVIKYERPLDMDGKNLLAYPGFLHKTSEMRIQTIQEILMPFNGTRGYITEKVDGQSVTMYSYNSNFGVCGHSVEFDRVDTTAPWTFARDFELEPKLKAYSKKFGINIAAQGELIGPGMERNTYNLKSCQWRLFNAFIIDTHKIGSLDDLLRLADFLKIDTVPILDNNYIIDASDIDSLVELSKGKSVIGNVNREGIVIRSKELISDAALGRLSFKIINPDFLLKYKD